MFESTAAFGLFDYFRIPYERVPPGGDVPEVASLRATDGEPRLLWISSPQGPPGVNRGVHLLEGIPIFGTVASDRAVRERLGLRTQGWRPQTPIFDGHGRRVSSIWRASDGSVFLPFDPDEIIAAYLSERYKEWVNPSFVRSLNVLARRSYYRLRPLLPRSAQLQIRRSFSRTQARVTFPRWPIETALHDFYTVLLAIVTELAPEPVPMIATWPRGFSWALVLTHDVERPSGFANMLPLLKIELRNGYRSSWNFVPERGYSVDDVLVRELLASGFEVGVHGLLHDGRDVSSARMLKKRLPRMRQYAERWDAAGFRSPGTIRSWQLMPLLGFDYDSSYSDTAPFEPQGGGSCTWLPYMIQDVVELPITLPQDHTLFELLGHADAGIWCEKARFLRDRGGMALMLTHPDYFHDPRLLAFYTEFLEEFRDDDTAWRPLPREVSGWWRRRLATSLHRIDGGWGVRGAAEREASIEFLSRQRVRV